VREEDILGDWALGQVKNRSPQVVMLEHKYVDLKLFPCWNVDDFFFVEYVLRSLRYWCVEHVDLQIVHSIGITFVKLS
jgi:hypothetical protein